MNNKSFKRGVQAASGYKKLTKTAQILQDTSERWASRHGLPSFVGRLPVPILIALLITILLFSGLLIGGVILLIAAFVYMLTNITINPSDEDYGSRDSSYGGHEYRDGPEGFGLYSGPDDINVTSGRVDWDDDED